jgi:hypothetical protein
MLTLKKTISNIMFTTGASLVLLAVFLKIIDSDINYVRAVLEIFGANIVINFGIFLIHKFEIRYIILEYLLDISLIIIVLVVSGAIFNWYSAIPVWLLIVMAVVIYLFVIITNITKIKKDTKEINELLQKRKEKKTDTAS